MKNKAVEFPTLEEQAENFISTLENKLKFVEADNVRLKAAWNKIKSAFLPTKGLAVTEMERNLVRAYFEAENIFLHGVSEQHES